MMNSATVSAELGLTLIVPEHGAIPLAASLYYSAGDPFAICMAFHVGADEPVEWTFARDLLADGLGGPAGQGDVQAWPGDDQGEPVLNIVLSSPFGEAHVRGPIEVIREFLELTYKVISAGHETDFVDLDGELDELLWRA